MPVVQRLSHLPVIVDPSHSGGRRDLVLPLSRAAIAVGADGIMVDVHPHPETALCDGPQALIESDLRELAQHGDSSVAAGRPDADPGSGSGAGAAAGPGLGYGRGRGLGPARVIVCASAGCVATLLAVIGRALHVYVVSVAIGRRFRHRSPQRPPPFREVGTRP